MKISRGLSFWFVLFLSFNALAQKNYTPAELKEDYTILRNFLEEYHAGLYWYRSKNYMDSVFDTSFDYLSKSMSDEEFYKQTMRTISQIGCLHTTQRASKKFEKSVFAPDRKYFPLKFKILCDEVIVHQNLSQSNSIRQGDQLLAIDGVPIDEIISRIKEYVPSDGHENNWALFIIEHYFEQFYHFIISNKKLLEVSFLDSLGNSKDVMIETLNMEKINNFKSIRYPNSDVKFPLIELSFRDNLSTAVLKIYRFSNWTLDEIAYDFKKVLHQKMQEIIDAQVEHLIIDVGDLGGGNDMYGKRLLSYFINETFDTYRAIEFKVDNLASFKHISLSRKEYNRIRNTLNLKKKDSTFNLTNHWLTDPTTPNTLHFSGNIYLIVGRATASATSDFAAWMHSLDLATIIGEETGGSYLGNTSNWILPVVLPNSKIRVFIPLARYLNNVDTSIFFGRGLIPEHKVCQTKEDYLSGIDTQLNFALELIKKANLK